MGVNKQFQDKTAKYKNHNISETVKPAIAPRVLSNVTQIKYNIAANGHLEKWI